MMQNSPCCHLSGLLDPTPQPHPKKALKRRRFRRCKSAPLADNIPQELILPPSEPIFGKLHTSLRQVAIFLAVYLGVGTICFYLIMDQIMGKKTNGVLDSLYFCIMTMTTVGNGDLVPHSILAKLLACVFVFTGMALVALILGKAANYLVEKQELLLVKALHIRQKAGQTDFLKETETNKVRYKGAMVLILVLVLISIGIISLAFVEGLNLVDAFYCVCSSITTLGYEDKSFSTETKVIGQMGSYSGMTNIDLEAVDLDDDVIVSVAKFIVYKLKELVKISQEDISLVMEEFEDLDVDQSGTLLASDLMLAQASETGR